MSIFSSVQSGRPGKSLIDLSHEKKLTLNFGDLVPIMLHETVPGDSFQIRTESHIKFHPMTFPVLHRINARFEYWFVPNRLLFDGWETFITGGADGKQTASMPHLQNVNIPDASKKVGTLWDYLGLPCHYGANPTVHDCLFNALPFRAYHLIWNEYYRDQNLQAPANITKSNGLITGSEQTELLKLRKRALHKDYFTSGLPWTQRGDEVTLPMEPVYKSPEIKGTDGSPLTGFLSADNNGDFTVASGNTDPNAGYKGGTFENLESSGVVTINDLRRSARLQEFLEKTARGGSRLTEVVKAFFGVRSSDARLQRPEFIGASKQPINISEVLATFNNETVVGGSMYGHGVSFGNSGYKKKFCEEHGWIVGIMSILPTNAYSQGIPKHFLKLDKFDLYWPTFAQLGEQEIINKELWFDHATNEPDKTFAYQSRYAEYKYCPSTVHGDFRDTLMAWHCGMIFTQQPSLNEDFIVADNAKFDRIFAVEDPTVQKIYVQLYNDVKSIRPMPYFNNPIL